MPKKPRLNKAEPFDLENQSSTQTLETLAPEKTEIAVPQDQATTQNQVDSLRLVFSKSTVDKLKEAAEHEGIGIEKLAEEFINQALIKRAWETPDLNHQNRYNQQSNNNQRKGNPNSSNTNNRNNRPDQNKNRGRMPHSRYQAIMDDKASFLEYVRSQDPNRRR